jgi:predicted AAA+ superfamily ATPase
VGWLLAVLWRTEWLRSVGNFPLLFVVGPRALGKNTFMRVAMQLFGMESNPISLNGLTDTSIYTVNNRFCNIPGDSRRHVRLLSLTKTDEVAES